MRELIFKAIQDSDHQWVEGDFYREPHSNPLFWSHFIIDNKGKRNLVDPNTLCEYTGLKDKNKERLFEKDIFKAESSNPEVHGKYVYYEIIYRNGTWMGSYIISESGQVMPSGYTCGILIDCFIEDIGKSFYFEDGYLPNIEQIKRVGNVYDKKYSLENFKVDIIKKSLDSTRSEVNE